MNRRIEILAPAGSYEAMRAAMNAGCDAVYIGGNSYGARAYAENPEEDMLLQAIDEAHIRDKKLYLTVNTLLKEKELTGQLYRFLEKFYLRGLDAVIVQDVGVLHFIHRNFPELPVHASTQMTLTMAQGANLLTDYGVTRLVTSRELSLKEIKTLRENTQLEIETFVHGALCYCYSGQCLMSSLIGGRSGNRGRCAQPCRMPYQFYAGREKLSTSQEKYLLSPKDINTIALLPELIEAGIDSFKIEGRMKRPEYAAAVASVYRSYADLYLTHGKEYYEEYLKGDNYRKDMLLLQDVYNRGGFSEGYAKSYHGKSMMSLYRPNHSGVLVGEVSAVKGSQVVIHIKEELYAQDILEIRHQEEEGYEFTVKEAHGALEELTTNVGRRPDKQAKVPSIRIGDQVYRTKNNHALEQLKDTYINQNRRLGIQGSLLARKGEALLLTVTYKEFSYAAVHDLVQEAVKQPMTKEKLAAPIEKTGDTLFSFDRLTIDMDENIFVPVAWLNEIRREALLGLQQEILRSYERQPVPRMKIPPEDRSVFSRDEHSRGFSVTVQTQEQYKEALKYNEISSIYVDYDAFPVDELPAMAKLAMDNNKEFLISLPHICRLSVYDELFKTLPKLMGLPGLAGFVVKNLEEIALLQSLGIREKHKRLLLNYNLYTFNTEAKCFFQELGITEYTAPVELNYHELKTLGIEDGELMVYGYLPVMVSAQCLFESTKGCRKCREGNDGRMVDRLGKSFVVKANCKGCYNIIYNSQPLSLLKQKEEVDKLNPKSIRLDFTRETREEMQKVMTAFSQGFCYGRKTSEDLSDYTTGHFKRGVE